MSPKMKDLDRNRNKEHRFYDAVTRRLCLLKPDATRSHLYCLARASIQILHSCHS